ncbi:hypothetical protein GCM10010873_16550 [Cypionkella aquatica]|uniref:Uncharacterized protein n=1 Tax=Cypionkella aquatica TaxID=1756042 RepID=A0AA37U725_9RHOB|nr:phage tail tube protein [Cypionkella aquatica]GLS86681.1 hypothetical protein GCM10010873_16550 [Cypionkella aquatica]
MFMRLQALLVKAEVTYGTDPVPTGAANAILAQNVKISPMKGSDVKRDYDRPYFSAAPTIPVGLHMSISFEIELKGNGAAGTALAFGPLLRACKWAQVLVASTSVTYTPHSGTQESCTIYWYLDGQLYKLVGVRGTFTYKLNALGIPVLAFEMTGLWAAPSTVAIPTVTLGTQLSQIPQVASSANTPTFTYGGTALILRSFEFNAGAEVKPRFLVGKEEIIITNAEESIKFTIETPPLATFNPIAVAAAASTAAMVLVHGTGAGKICTLNMPAVQIARPEGFDDQDGIVEMALTGMPLPVAAAGNDQASLVFT